MTQQMLPCGWTCIILDNDSLPAKTESKRTLRVAEMKSKLVQFTRLQEMTERDLERVSCQKRDALSHCRMMWVGHMWALLSRRHVRRRQQQRSCVGPNDVSPKPVDSTMCDHDPGPP